MLNLLHACHLGIVKCTQKARDLFYWPGLASDIHDMISRCAICKEYQYSNQKEPLIPHDTSNVLWENLAADLFMWNNKSYLLVVDFYSRYFEVAVLYATTSADVIHHMKSFFSRHGIPKSIVTDNGSQFTSYSFAQFSKVWKINHKTSSLLYPQSNGLAEKTVQTAKRLLTTALKTNRNPYLNIFEYRNTPIRQEGSPAQLLMGRRLRKLISMTNKQLQQQTVKPSFVRRQFVQRRQNNKRYYDRNAKPLRPLQKRDRVHHQVGKTWEPAIVVGKATTRFYDIKTEEGSTYRRN